MRELAWRFQHVVDDLEPEQAALLLSVGLVLGVFSPLQLVLLLPLARAGAWLCGTAVFAGASPVHRLGAAAVQAVIGWACICIPLGALLYVILVLVIRRGLPTWVNGLKSPA